MNRIAKIVTVLVLVLAMLALGACSSSQTVATVGGREIKLSSLENAFRNYQSYNGTYFNYDLSTEEGLNDFREMVMESLIESEMYVYQAEQLGMQLTDEEKAEAKEQGMKDFDDIYQQYLDYAKQAGAQDATAYANSQLTNVLTSNGLTLEGLKAQLIETAERSKLTEKVTNYLKEQGTPDEAKLEELFLNEQEAQKMEFDADPSMYFYYETMWNYYVNYGYDLGATTPLYVPEGFIRVQNILVEDQATANELYANIISGAMDYDTALADYNTDPGMSSYPEGYLVGEGANYVQEFLDAAMALEKDGDISEPVETEYGWHILRRVRTEPAGPLAYEGSLKQLMDYYYTDKQVNSYVSEVMKGWVETEGLVTRNEALISKVK